MTALLEYFDYQYSEKFTLEYIKSGHCTLSTNDEVAFKTTPVTINPRAKQLYIVKKFHMFISYLDYGFGGVKDF